MSPSHRVADLELVEHDELGRLIEHYGQPHVARFASDRTDAGWLFRPAALQALRAPLDMQPVTPASVSAPTTSAPRDALHSGVLRATRRLRFDCRHGGFGDICTMAWLMRGYESLGVDAAFCYGNGPKATLASLLGVRMDVAPVERHLRIPLGNKFPPYSYELLVDRGERARVDVWSETLPWRPPAIKPHLSVPPCGARWAYEEVREKRCPNGEPLALIFPSTSGYIPREWPLPYWWDLCEMLHGCGVGVAVMLPPEHKTLSTYFHRMTYYGQNIKRVIGAIADADLVISADTGPAHIAGCADTPALALLGPTRNVFNHYDSVRAIAVSEQEQSCVGCHFHGGRGFRAACGKGCAALYKLTPDRVAAEAAAVLGVRP